jgi:subtilisin family serine protease
VCVIDSGVDGLHPDIGGRVESYRICPAGEEGQFVVESDDQGDVAGHGTH